MAQHYLLSSKSKNINLKDILRLTEEDAFHLLKTHRWGNTGNIRDVCFRIAAFVTTPIFSNLANAGVANIANVIFILPPTRFLLFTSSL